MTFSGSLPTGRPPYLGCPTWADQPPNAAIFSVARKLRENCGMIRALKKLFGPAPADPDARMTAATEKAGPDLGTGRVPGPWGHGTYPDYPDECVAQTTESMASALKGVEGNPDRSLALGPQSGASGDRLRFQMQETQPLQRDPALGRKIRDAVEAIESVWSFGPEVRGPLGLARLLGKWPHTRHDISAMFERYRDLRVRDREQIAWLVLAEALSQPPRSPEEIKALSERFAEMSPIDKNPPRSPVPALTEGLRARYDERDGLIAARARSENAGHLLTLASVVSKTPQTPEAIKERYGHYRAKGFDGAGAGWLTMAECASGLAAKEIVALEQALRHRGRAASPRLTFAAAASDPPKSPTEVAHLHERGFPGYRTSAADMTIGVLLRPSLGNTHGPVPVSPRMSPGSHSKT